MVYKDGKRVVITDHAALQYAKRYASDLGLEAARTKVGDHFYRSDAKMLDALSPQGDQLWLLPELDCVVVFKPDSRDGHEGDWVIPTVLPNPARKMNIKPLAGLAKLREFFPPAPKAPPPDSAALPPPAWEAPPEVPPEAPPRVFDLAPLRALEGRLRGRAAGIRAAVAEAPGTSSLATWADRQMTIASELDAVADDLDNILGRIED